MTMIQMTDTDCLAVHAVTGAMVHEGRLLLCVGIIEPSEDADGHIQSLKVPVEEEFRDAAVEALGLPNDWRGDRESDDDAKERSNSERIVDEQIAVDGASDDVTCCCCRKPGTVNSLRLCGKCSVHWDSRRRLSWAT